MFKSNAIQLKRYKQRKSLYDFPEEFGFTPQALANFLVCGQTEVFYFFVAISAPTDEESFRFHCVVLECLLESAVLLHYVF